MGPAAGAPGGALTIGYTIFTTGEDIRGAKDDPKVTGKVGWLPPPAVGEMAYFTVALMKPNRQHIELRHALPVAAFSMKSGEALLITRPAAPSGRRRRSSSASSARGLHSRGRRLWPICRTLRSQGR
jgi:hypothetical protein